MDGGTAANLLPRTSARRAVSSMSSAILPKKLRGGPAGRAAVGGRNAVPRRTGSAAPAYSKRSASMGSSLVLAMLQWNWWSEV